MTSRTRTRLGLRILSAAVVGTAVIAGIVTAANHGHADVAARDRLGLTIVSPTPGSTVSGPVRFVFRVTGARLGTPEQGLDHLHVAIDGGVPAGLYQDSVAAKVPPGVHTLKVELADPTHESLGVTATETFTVSGSH